MRTPKLFLLLLLSILFTMVACDGGIKVVDAPNSKLEPLCAGCISNGKAASNVGLARQRQVFGGFQSCLKLNDADIAATTRQTFARLMANFSQEGRLEDLNGPMVLSLAQLAAEFCMDRIRLENRTGERMFFGSFSSTGAPTTNPTNPGTSVLNPVGGAGGGAVVTGIDGTIQALARSCWSRTASPAEVKAISDSFSASSVSRTMNDSAALFLCTTVLTSPESILY